MWKYCILFSSTGIDIGSLARVVSIVYILSDILSLLIPKDVNKEKAFLHRYLRKAIISQTNIQDRQTNVDKIFNQKSTMLLINLNNYNIKFCFIRNKSKSESFAWLNWLYGVSIQFLIWEKRQNKKRFWIIVLNSIVNAKPSKLLSQKKIFSN